MTFKGKNALCFYTCAKLFLYKFYCLCNLFQCVFLTPLSLDLCKSFCLHDRKKAVDVLKFPVLERDLGTGWKKYLGKAKSVVPSHSCTSVVTLTQSSHTHRNAGTGIRCTRHKFCTVINPCHANDLSQG